MKRAASLLILIAASLQMTSAEVTTISTEKSSTPVEQSLSSGIARFGSHTQAQISDSGTITLTQGLALISSESGLFRHSAVKVITPQGEITVRGTAIIAILADGTLKITCLEGQVKQNLGGEKQTLEPGMISLLTLAGQTALAQVELLPLIQSSALLGASLPKLPRSASLARIAESQAKTLNKASGTGAALIANGQTPDQANASGASNIVALNNVIEASAGLTSGNSVTGSFGYTGGSVSSGVTVSSGAIFSSVNSQQSSGFGNVSGGSTMTGGTIRNGLGTITFNPIPQTGTISATISPQP
jgi:FecR protein